MYQARNCNAIMFRSQMGREAGGASAPIRSALQYCTDSTAQQVLIPTGLYGRGPNAAKVYLPAPAQKTVCPFFFWGGFYDFFFLPPSVLLSPRDFSWGTLGVQIPKSSGHIQKSPKPGPLYPLSRSRLFALAFAGLSGVFFCYMHRTVERSSALYSPLHMYFTPYSITSVRLLGSYCTIVLHCAFGLDPTRLGGAVLA
jgi:hypothetical protein